ncbi:hypothetical protein ACFQ1S_12090 [Kibdelosporangium lantanae]|uniref:Uncharacterized protein n=1 Tax=Kibdelosporangium lantanae TaxID=1497396 RepID=A0ABW3M8B0_9PSEU
MPVWLLPEECLCEPLGEPPLGPVVRPPQVTDCLPPGGVAEEVDDGVHLLDDDWTENFALGLKYVLDGLAANLETN